ncbi:hypothetical protein Patl1_19691 [Pistacia atlantica]|uniref:Uncharacterized protein n=1 Tax=Pistacia atlantica TaxID=434234 RepID=A0ACC1C3E2_9ROSI|nr:hypothetical protein Patl1_19691 [Pistacia atlantica]
MAFFSLSFFKIHPQLSKIVAKMTFFDALLFYIVHLVDKLDLWHRLPVLLGLAYMGIRRHLHQRYNLLHVGEINGQKYDTEEFCYRTADGKCNHPSDDTVGSQGTFFGRNMPPSSSAYGFMIHDWIDHLEDTKQVELTVPEDIASSCPMKSFKFFKTKRVPTASLDMKIGSLNTRTPWWDGSVIYGNNDEGMRRVMLEIAGQAFPFYKPCLSKSTMLYVICSKRITPDFDDEKLYRHARLVTSAVIAKVHTIDWTVELLKTDTLLAGMRLNWYGLLGKKFKDLFGPILGPILTGLVGLKKPRDHGVPYSLTEEFVSVYRMHCLLPDELIIRDIKSTEPEYESPPIQEEVPMKEMAGKEGERRLSKIGMEQMMVSMGHQSCGALTLWNYPSWMRDLVVHDINGEDRPNRADMAALEIYRDRERGVARYNEFRRNLLMVPISKWEDLTDDEEIVKALHEVYGDDIEKLDLLVGLHAEKKIKGFAISETAFFIFLLIASRRLEADRFFTTNFNSQTYTEKGLEWVNKTETLKDVIDRHFPDMTKKMDEMFKRIFSLGF